MGCCSSNAYGIVGSLKSSSRLTTSASGDVFGESVGLSFVCIPDSSVEFKKLGELFRCRLGSLNGRSTKNTSESIEMIQIYWKASLKFFKNKKVKSYVCRIN